MKNKTSSIKNKEVKSLLEPLIPPVLMSLAYDAKSLITYYKFKHLIEKNTQLKGIHKDDRCFIIGSGPSIEKQNLSLLKDEVIIALNNFYVHPTFNEVMDGKRPKYYLTAPTHGPNNKETWAKWLEDISLHTPHKTKMIFGVNNYPDNIACILEEYRLFNEKDVFWYATTNRYVEKYGFKERYMNLTQPVMSCNAASVYALMFAVYMGFKKIYLIGIEHSQLCCRLNNSRKNFYKKALHQKNEKGRSSTDQLVSLVRTFYQYESISKFSESQIVNLSIDSLLDMFEYEDFETAIKNSKL